MPLPFRQRKLFLDTADFYAPSNFTKTSKRVTSGQEFPSTPTYSGVVCHIQSSVEATVPSSIGRQDYDVMDTMDMIRVSIDQAIGAGWMVKLTTDGHPEEGTWYITQGDARNYNKLGTRVAYMKKSTKPPGVA